MTLSWLADLPARRGGGKGRPAWLAKARTSNQRPKLVIQTQFDWAASSKLNNMAVQGHDDPAWSLVWRPRQPEKHKGWFHCADIAEVGRYKTLQQETHTIFSIASWLAGTLDQRQKLVIQTQFDWNSSTEYDTTLVPALPRQAGKPNQRASVLTIRRTDYLINY